jgi:hypothetical protein
VKVDGQFLARTAVGAAPSADGSTQDVATQVIGLLDQIEALIPGFQHHDTNDAKRVAAAARFAPDLLPQVITTVTALPPVGGVNTFDVEGGRAALAFNETLQPVVQRLSSLLDGVQFTIDSRLAKAATQGLSTYAWAKKHAKGPDGVALRPYLDGMTRTIKKVLNRRKSSASTTAPPSTPVPHAQGFLAPKLAQPGADIDDDLPPAFREALEEAVRDCVAAGLPGLAIVRDAGNSAIPPPARPRNRVSRFTTRPLDGHSLQLRSWCDDHHGGQRHRTLFFAGQLAYELGM